MSYLCPQKTLFLLDSQHFSHFLFYLILKYIVSEPDCHRLDVASGNFQIRMKGTVNWARVVRRPILTFKSTCPYMAYGLDLQTSQLPCHCPHLKSADQPWPSGFKYGSLRGCVQHKYCPTAQIASKTMDIHGNFHQPSL